MMVPCRGALFSAVLFLPSVVLAQATTGTITGTVTSEGKAIPGVTITIASPSLQGLRTTVSGEAGGYSFPNVPPGEYSATFELAGMQTVRKSVIVDVSTTSHADIDLTVVPLSEAVTVVAAASPAVESTPVATNFKMDMISELPTLDRSLRSIILLAPGVNDAGPNSQMTISGGYSYDNIYLVDGVIVNENTRGQPNPLYIEDAIQETTVLAGAVSAEFGRFTGGVVSTVTKSGGNVFAGSLRDNLSNPSWSTLTAFPGQPARIHQLNHEWEGTLGGRIVRDRLWFFTAGRYQTTTLQRTTTFTAIPYRRAEDDRRYEAKFTAQVAPKHSIVGAYIHEHDLIANSVAGPTSMVMDLRSLVPFDRPRSLLSLNYNGIVSPNVLLEGQFSRMRDSFTNGAEDRSLEQGTLLIDTSSGNRMWSSTFCGSPCPPKVRDGKEFIGKASWFVSTRRRGNHSLVGGLDEFHQLRNEDNYQSGSDFRIHGIVLCDKGGIATPCASMSTSQLRSTDVYFSPDPNAGGIEYTPVAELSHTSDFAVRSLFINDKWDFGRHWSFNTGARYDKAFGRDQAGNKTVDDSAWSPRLAAAFDPKSNGQHRFSVTYGRYVSKVDQGPADSTSTAGRYADYYWDYKGPQINKPGTPISQLLPTDQVIRQIFDWFNAAGGTKAGPPLLTRAVIPGTTSRFDHPLQAPYMDEITAGYALAFGNRGFLRADYIHRKWMAFYSLRRTIATGKTVDANGNTFDQGVIENSAAGLSRRYRALQLQGTCKIMKALTAGGNYTYSRLSGNVEGETAGGGTTLTSFQNYPEYTSFAQSNPVGSLGADMRHRANLWMQYDLPTRAGGFNFSLLERFHSALGYSAAGTIDVRAGVANGPVNGVVNPGYATPPTSVTYFFSDRGAFRLESVSSTDLSVNWYAPALRGVRLFVETDVINIFDRSAVEDPTAVNQTVLTRRQTTCFQSGSTARCLAFNPFTDTPKLGVNFQYGPTFGQTSSPNAYQSPRQLHLAVGLKF